MFCMDLSRHKLFFQISFVIFILFTVQSFAGQPNSAFFFIEVLDQQTERGVPMVELRTTSYIRLYTDSNGIAAFYEPGLMGQKVFFYVESPGYEFPADGFGIRGTTLDTQPGRTATLKIKRQNIAQRLYRITGQGIYRDSVIAGQKVPIQEPLLNGQVCGQDSVNNCIYQNKLFWFWGDTARVGYALGQFSTAGATSELYGQDTLDPDRGINLKYFVDKTGFSKKMFPLPDPGMLWIDGVIAVVNDQKQERMLCHFARHKELDSVYERGLGVFNDSTQCFEPILRDSQPLMPYVNCGHAAPVVVNGTKYWYFTVPFPAAVRMRVKSTWKDATDPNRYEVFTALGQNRTQTASYRWVPFGTLLKGFASRSQAQEALSKEWKSFCLYDIESGKSVKPHNGSVYWNNWRNKWIMIFHQAGGDKSYLGEVWYAEADTPVGPWAYARKIMTHTQYSFYNPKQHPYFDKDNRRIIYFEGTYTYMFSGDEKQATPRYEYNQIMCRLDLTDPRLRLPEAVYELEDKSGHVAQLSADAIRGQNRVNEIRRVAFYAYPSVRPEDVKSDASGGKTDLQNGEYKNPSDAVLYDWQAEPNIAYYKSRVSQ
jgi:hypothetical protein